MGVKATELWGKPFHPISSYYRARFGSRVQTIPVTIASDCPNRRGLRGMQTCIFCDEWGSAAYVPQRDQDLETQILQKIRTLGPRYNAKNFLIYYQAYTSTFLAVKTLRKYIETGLAIENVHGFVVGTRPDCLSPAVLDLWNEYCDKCFVSVEFGIQTINNQQLEFLRRGHTAEDSFRAIRLVKEKTNVHLGVHLIFGNPGETNHQMIETATILNELGVDSVKLHNLHVLEGTPLATLYREGNFSPISLETYTERVSLFLQHLNPNIHVQRVAAVSSRWNELVAPDWCRYKMKSNGFIEKTMRDRGIYQGQRFSAPI